MLATPTLHLPAVTDQSFKPEVLAAKIPVLVDFWATWCGPCRQMEPLVKELATQYADRLHVMKMDVDANPITPGGLGIMSIPTLILFTGGTPRLRIVGVQPLHKLKAQLEAALTP
jgi:thioredoxin 1